MKRYLVVWYNYKLDSYYYKIVRGFYQCKYYPGLINQYNHEVVLVIPFVYKVYQEPLKKRLIKRLISFLEKIE